MSHAKVAPEGLKPQECERNSGRSRPPIPYIPEKDSIQEAVDSSANTLKLTLPHKVELRVPVWSKGTPEQFLVHVQQALDAIRQKGLLAAYEKAEKDKEECTKKLVNATEALSKYTGDTTNTPEGKAVEKATEAVDRASEALESIANQVFQLYSNLLTEEARRPWTKILGEQIDCAPWVDLFGVEHAEKRQRSWSSFMDCVTFHLQTVFRSDAAETQRFYISNGLKKPNRVPIRQFVQRIQQLNGYLDLLPCLYYSDRATKLTKEVKPFDDVDLASHILRMVPRNWQDQYELTGATVPQSVRKLLEALERIEKAFPTDKEREGTQASAKGGGSSKKKMVSFNDRIPKKRRTDAKHCVLCKKHGGAHNTHNTSECRKYDKDGTPKKSFAGKSAQRGSRSGGTQREQSNYAQLSAKIAKLEKSNRKLKRANRKRKRDRDSDSEDSDSS
jgi:hypothetical protein